MRSWIILTNRGYNGWSSIMVIDTSLIEEYPFEGVFYRRHIDMTKPVKERVVEEEILLETVCDIQEATTSDNVGINNAIFNVYFPFDLEVGIVDIRRGDAFRGSMYGVEVNGEIDGLFPSQLGGCKVHIKDFTV